MNELEALLESAKLDAELGDTIGCEKWLALAEMVLQQQTAAILIRLEEVINE